LVEAFIGANAASISNKAMADCLEAALCGAVSARATSVQGVEALLTLISAKLDELHTEDGQPLLRQQLLGRALRAAVAGVQ
jgi:hypothetical protein